MTPVIQELNLSDLDRLPIAVVESKWFLETNTSVKGLFDLLADLFCHNPSAYHYEMFGSKAAFRDVFHRVARGALTKEIYVASHGCEEGIQVPTGVHFGDDLISRHFIRETVRNFFVAGNKRIDGMFFGCCKFGTAETAAELLEAGPDGGNTLRWIAGYTTSVDWIDSSALDMLFWSRYLSERHLGGASPNAAIENVCSDLKEKVGGLCSHLGLSVYIRNGGRTGGVRDLLA